MPITLNGTTGIQNVLGSASAPADTNTTTPTTGVYYPSATTWGVSTAGTNALYIDASQNVGIGTTSPSTYGKMAVVGGDGNGVAFVFGATGGMRLGGYNGAYSGSSIEAVNAAQSAYQPMAINGSYTVLATGGTERMRIDSSGNLLVGTTTASNSPSQGITLSPNSTIGNVGIGHANGTGSGNTYMQFAYNGTAIGTVTQNGTTGVLYNITSDQRLKTNIVDAPSASSIIDAIQIRSFDWKSDGSHNRYGVIAQELNEIVPEAVHTPADDTKMMGVDYSKLVPLLVKALQELKAEFDAYKAAHP
jgi:hypothetical protein